MLPKIETIAFDLVLPVAKTKIKYRPYTIKEEKILLLAMKSDDTDDMIKAVKQVVNNCVITSNFDVDTIHTFDLEYLLVNLRIVSVSNELDLSFKDEDGRTYQVVVDLPNALTEIVSNAKIPDKIIPLSDKVGVEMKDITIDMLMSGELEGINDPLLIYKVLPKVITHVYDENQIYKFDDATEEEIEEFFDSFDKKATKALSSYFESIPRLYYEISYTNAEGTVRKIELNGLADFFQLS